MKKCEDVTNIYFFETKKGLCEGNYYLKKQIVRALEAARLSSEKNSIKKDSNEKSIIYRFTMDDMKVNLYISKNYEDLNKEYIDIFNNWQNKDKKRKLKNLKLIAITSAASIVFTSVSYETVKELFENLVEKVGDLLTDEVGDLERELLIHSGYAETPDGRHISPFLGHDCVFVQDNELTVSDKITQYCEDHNLDYMKEVALEKFNHLMNNNKEFADTINLKEMEKEFKERQKIKN